MALDRPHYIKRAVGGTIMVIGAILEKVFQERVLGDLQLSDIKLTIKWVDAIT